MLFFCFENRNIKFPSLEKSIILKSAPIGLRFISRGNVAMGNPNLTFVLRFGKVKHQVAELRKIANFEMCSYWSQIHIQGYSGHGESESAMRRQIA